MHNFFSTEHQRLVFNDRYRQIDGETIEQAFMRVAKSVIIHDTKLSLTKEEQIKALYDDLISGKYITSGRPLSNLGENGNNMVFNCFVLPIEDSRKSITSTLADFTEVAALGGGIGISYSTLRPKGDVTKTSRGISSGPCSFIDVFQSMGSTIKQNGTRGLATMTTLRIDHPDIEEFIQAKYENGRWPTTNLSVGLTDKFMKAVYNDSDFNLVWKGEVRKTLKARYLWDMICNYAYHNGEPGVLFLDTINNNTPFKDVFRIEATNPCQPANALLWDGDRLRRIDDSNAKTWKSWKTGIREVFEVKTNTGLTFYGTGDHNIILSDGSKCPIIKSLGKELYQPKDFPIEMTSCKFTLDENLVNEGSLFGNYIKSINSIPIKDASLDTPNIPEDVLYGDQNKIMNFLRGVISVFWTKEALIKIPILRTNSGELAKTVQLLLGILGVNSSIFDSNSLFGNTYKLYIEEESVDWLNYELNKKDFCIRQATSIPIFVTQISSVGEQEVWDYKMHQAPHYNYCQGTILSNCAEEPLPSNFACNLGSVILTNFVDKETGKIDFAGIEQAAYRCAVLLDGLIDVSTFPTKAIEENTKNYRPVGVGVMGFADLLLFAGVPYGNNKEALEIAYKVANAISEGSEQASRDLANEFGPFPKYHSHKFDFAPRRNIVLTSYAPTGSISALCDVSSGIEPHFAPVVKRREEVGVSVTELKSLKEYMEIHGLTEYPTHARFAIGNTPEQHSLTPMDHLAILKVFANNCDAAVSKTIGLPNSATVEDISNSFKYCWENKIKGCTVYREGSRSDAPIQSIDSTSTTEDNEIVEDYDIEIVDLATTVKERPNTLEGETVKIKPNPGGPSLYVMMNDFEDSLFEVFFKTSDAIQQELLDMCSRAITGLLRRGVDIRFLIDDFKKYESPSGGGWYHSGNTHKRIKSISDAVGIVLEEHCRKLEIGESERVIDTFNLKNDEDFEKLTPEQLNDIECPECGNFTYLVNGGCRACTTCGYSKCG